MFSWARVAFVLGLVLELQACDQIDSLDATTMNELDALQDRLDALLYNARSLQEVYLDV